MACPGVSGEDDTCKNGRRGARKTVPSRSPLDNAAVHEPLPMNPLVQKGMAREGTGVG